MNKPIFYQAKLVEVKNINFYLNGSTLEERMPNNAECTECGKNEWWLLPIQSIAVQEGGKAYCECLNCGAQTHL